MTPASVRVDGVSKEFRLYHERHSTLKERFVHFGRERFERYWALKDVSFTIDPGESVGLIGANGSGKSTLLKIIAGILRPTHGSVETNGRIAALLELGAGFHSELSGRENVFMNASILGLSKRETEARFDEIVAFAELERFIDMQVKHYSSGMYVRLGFAVAVNMDPDVLLVDEVLAVGDESFQRKCIERVRQFQSEGRTIVFVTHAVDLVRQLCDRAVVLDHGRVVSLGTPGEAVREFREHLLQKEAFTPAVGEVGTQDEQIQTASAQESKRDFRVRITGVNIVRPASGERRYLLPGEPLEVQVAFEAATPTDDVAFGIAIYDEEGRVVFGTNTDILGVSLGVLPREGELAFNFDSVLLLDGTYQITLGVHSHDEGTVYDWREQQHQFEVMHPGRTAGLVALGLNVTVMHNPMQEIKQ